MAQASLIDERRSLTVYGAMEYGGFYDFCSLVLAITKACLNDKLLSLDTPSLFTDKARDI